MAEAVHRGDIDMCGLGTPLMMEPGLVKKILGNEEWKGKSKL
jgi:2,4-dienoyl-CoA reductase-like NADH-dependent reductase (Old Yellow Enzyme family)